MVFMLRRDGLGVVFRPSQGDEPIEIEVPYHVPVKCCGAREAPVSWVEAFKKHEFEILTAAERLYRRSHKTRFILGPAEISNRANNI
jgi:hypothetical protein